MKNNSLINKCFDRASLLKNNSEPELSKDSIQNVENKLNIILPEDFIMLCTFYGYDFFRFFDFFNFCSDTGVIEETLYYRENYYLPSNYIVLSWDDVSFVLLNVESGKSEVIWCDYPDFFNLCDNLPMQYNPTIFSTFADFYKFLLDEEEKIRKEEQGNK